MEFVVAGLLVLVALFIYFQRTPRLRNSEVFQLVAGSLEVFGIVWLLAAFFLFLLVTRLLPSSGYSVLWSFGGLGIWQLIYAIPRSLSLKRQQRWTRLKGMIAGAAIVALLNGSCWFWFGTAGIYVGTVLP
jgi:Na+/proline symporter